MGTFFAFLYFAAFVVFVIFLVRFFINKKRGNDNSLNKKIWIVSLIVFILAFIITGIITPSPKEEAQVVVNESQEENAQESTMIETIESKETVANESTASKKEESEPGSIEETAEESISETTEMIELIAGELGDYGKEIVMNEGTDLEEKMIVYYVPAGKYKVENLGDYRTQVNVYKGFEKNKESGYDEYTDSGDIVVLNKGEKGDIEVPDGWYIEIHDSHILLTPDKNTTSLKNSADVNQDFIEIHKSEIVVAAKMALDDFIEEYDLSLAPQKWTIAKFDDTDTTVIAITDISYNGQKGKYIYVGTLNLNNSGKVDSAEPHYLEVNGEVLEDDGYAKDVFDKIKSMGN